ncbi:MAG: hypothetical protein GEU99_02380 [Luteitalea sp.]|nr:hypothetical protein [Luteitalea sp.]
MRIPRRYGISPELAHLGRVLLCLTAVVWLALPAQAQPRTDEPEYGIDVWTTDRACPRTSCARFIRHAMGICG